MRQALIKVAGSLGAWSLTRRLTRRVPRIFMLHRFSSRPDPRATDAESLGRFLDRVSSECEMLSLRDLVARFDDPAPARRTLACITVDDGYEDFYTVALPILAERGIPATIFATAGFIDGQCWLWWDALRYLIDAQPPGMLRVDLSGQGFSLRVDDAASRHAAWSTIAEFLVPRNEARGTAFAQLQAAAQIALPAHPTAPFKPMCWDQLREAERAGIEIGGHTMTHAFLPSLDAAGLRHELDDAKALLEQHLNRPVETFAYPNGMPEDCTPAVAHAVAAAGFAAAVVAYLVPFTRTNRYFLGRWSAVPSDQELEHILSGASILAMRARGAAEV